MHPPLPFGDVDEHAEQVMVAMRDRARLATDLYLPRGRGRRPAVLVRLPYDKSARFAFMPQISQRFTERGYAFVAQDVRGKVRSEGETLAFVHEVADGHDTLAWIAAQPWSDGTVAMFGDSYYGFTQWAAAASRHPALKAIVPRMTTTEIGTDWMYHQGVFCLSTMAEWALTTWLDRNLYEAGPDFDTRPLADVVSAAHGGRRSESFDRWIRTPAEDAAWTQGTLAGFSPRSLRIPALHSGGWWDVFQRGQVRDLLAATAAGAPGQHLVMDSTDHFDDELVSDGEPAPDILQDDGALERFLPSYVGPALAFFDRYLRGVAVDIPPVRWHLANEGWRTAETWPPARAGELDLHLVDAAHALWGPEGGALAGKAEAGGSTARWTHDPADPVPDLVGDAWRPLLGLPDEREAEARGDVLTFTGEPRAEPLDLAGPVVLDATAGGDGVIAHLAAKLVDVFPDGRSRRILQGVTLVPRPRQGRRARVDLGHTGYRLQPGHRLRLEIAASDFPRYLLDVGADADPWGATGGRPVERWVAVGGDGGATLRLTVLQPVR
jgi:uncharacterized protein